MKGSNKRIIGLDALKVFAMFWIVLAHIVDIKYNGIPGQDRWGAFNFFLSLNNDLLQSFLLFVLNLGGICVYFFYIASGFGLAVLFNKEKLSYLKFLKTRFIKILPTYYFIVFSLFAASLIKLYPIKISWSDFLSHIFLIHNFFKEYLFGISAPLWFIGVIIQLYLLFPILFTLSKKIKSVLFIILMLLFGIFSYSVFNKIFPGTKLITDGIFLFSLGIAFANYYVKRDFSTPTYWKSFIFGGGILLLFLSTLKINNIQIRGDLFFLIFCIAIALIFLSFLKIGENIKKITSIQFMFSLNYEIYMTHYVLIWMFFALFDLNLITAAIILIPASVLVGFSTHHVVKISLKLFKMSLFHLNNVFAKQYKKI